MQIEKLVLFISLCTFFVYGEENFSEVSSGKDSDTTEENKYSNKEAEISISSNPAAVNLATGTGAIGEMFGFKKKSGIRIGGLWIGDINYLFTGGLDPPI